MTMSNLVASKLEDVVLNFMDNAWAFTIYDVVRMARHKLSRNTDYPSCRAEVERLMNQEVAEANLNQQAWQTSHIYVDGFPCRLYHPVGFNPSNYNKDFHNPTKTKFTTPIVKVMPKVVKLPTAKQLIDTKKKLSTKNLRQTDKEGRLTIPVSMLKKFGLRSGSTVYVAARNNNQEGLVLLTKKPGSGLLQKIKLDSSMRVRLAAGLLKRSKLDLSNSLPKVSLTDRAIVVSPGA